MKTYARIENGVVVELLSTANDPAHLYNPALTWREVTTPGTQIGWIAASSGFTAPTPPTQAANPLPSLAQLQAELADLITRFAAFNAKPGV